jgi:hypothetical protein
VRIVDPPSVDELARQVADALDHPHPRVSDDVLSAWSWETRAREYAAEMDDVVGRESRPR